MQMDQSEQQPLRIITEPAQMKEQSASHAEALPENKSRSSHSRYTGTAKNKLIKEVQKLEMKKPEGVEKAILLPIPVCSIAKSSFGDRSMRSSSSKELLHRDSSLDLIAKAVPGSAASDSYERATLTNLKEQPHGDTPTLPSAPSASGSSASPTLSSKTADNIRWRSC
jgi:hypothetical protein